MGFGCGCGNTNQVQRNRPLNDISSMFKGNMIGNHANHVGALDIFQQQSSMSTSTLERNALKAFLRRK